MKENIGVGYVPDLRHPAAIERAAEMAGANGIVGALPKGLKTTLDAGAAGVGLGQEFGGGGGPGYARTRHGLSGGEVCVSPLLSFLATFFLSVPPC